MNFKDVEAGWVVSSGRVNGKQDPNQTVASGIFQINTAVSTFHRLVNTLGTPKDTPHLRDKMHKTRLHIGQLVKDTSAKLKQASESDHRVEVSANKKITDAKLAKDFQAVLKDFQKAQRLAAERETAYAPLVPQTVLPSSYNADEADGSYDKSSEQRAMLAALRRMTGNMKFVIIFMSLLRQVAGQSAGEIEEEESSSYVVPWYYVYFQELIPAIAVLFFLVVGISLYHLSSRARRPRAAERAEISQGLEEGPVSDMTPAITRILESVPVLSFSDIGEDRDTRCPICLEDFNQGDHIVSLPECNHLFRFGCILQFWFSRRRATCPICRRNYLTID